MTSVACSSPATLAIALLEMQQRVLENIIQGEPLAQSLSALCRIVEEQAEGNVRAAIMLTDPAGKHLLTGAAPSLPESYQRAMDGLSIATDVGTCSAAAARRGVVITVDIANDPGWTSLQPLALSLGLKAAWSMPIISSRGGVLGTFCTYFQTEREPHADERELVTLLVRTARLAIERQQSDAALSMSARHDRFLAELAAATQPLSRPADIMDITATLLAEHLEVDRCAYAEVEDERVFVITGEYSRGVPSIVGRWDVAAFGAGCERCMREGEAYIVNDVEHDLRITAENLAAYRATAIQAVICVPLHKEGRFTAAMAVHQIHPRCWTSHDIELVTHVVARCWEALERARVTHALHASEAQSRTRLDYAVRLSSVGFWYCDLPFDELVWDERVKDHFFFPAQARITLDDFYERMHPEDRQATREAIDASIGEHRSYDTIYRTVDPRTGAIKWIRALGGTAYAADGTPIHFDGVTVDVTAQRLDQERLAVLLEREREQARLLARVAEIAPAIHRANSPQRVLEITTDEARKLIGAHEAVALFVTREAGVLQQMSSVALSEQYQHLDPLAVAHGAAGVASEIAITHRPIRITCSELPGTSQPDQGPGLCGLLAVPLMERNGQPRGLVQLAGKCVGDFSELDEAILIQLAQVAAVALDNARLYDELREEDRRKDEFLATLAHELRNPLAPIRTGLEILRMGASDEQDARTRLMMERQVRHLVRMVDDLLDISRVKLGKITLKKERVSFQDVLDSALETARPLIDAHQHQFIVRLPGRALPLEVDPTRISQVISNLLNNAAKYTPVGGRIELIAVAHDAMLEIRISDTGVGIPADMLTRVFDVFTQVGHSIERSQGGLGLGLTLVRSIVAMHGGTVEASSSGPAQGSTFVVRLPLAAAAGVTVNAEPQRVASAAPGLRILVVDDNHDAADSLALLLGIEMHECRVAYSGSDALRLVASFEPHCVLLDIGLPGMNGYEVARQLRADASLPQPFLIAITGWGGDEDRRTALAAGFDRHLVKPIDQDQLTAIIEEWRSTVQSMRPPVMVAAQAATSQTQC